MTFNDKFLNVCFKIGKVTFSILLLLSLLVTLLLWINIGGLYLNSANHKATYKYDVKKIIQSEMDNLQKPQKENKTNPEQTNIPPDEQTQAMNMYNKFIEDNNLPKKELSLPNERELLYVKGFINFYKDLEKELKKAVIEYYKGKFQESQIELYYAQPEYKDILLSNAIEYYIKSYNEEMNTINLKKQQIDQQKQQSFIVALSSLCIFILFLFLPILIRIEENTRK